LTKNALTRITLFASILIIILFTIVKMRNTAIYDNGKTNPDWIFQLAVVLFFCSWLIGSILDVPFNNHTLGYLGIRVPIEAKTILIYAFMLVSFMFASISKNRIQFCGSILVLVIIEMINLVIIDKKYIWNQNYDYNKQNDQKEYLVRNEVHVLFRGTERRIRNAFNIAIPLMMIILSVIENVDNNIQIISMGIMSWSILIFIILSESWMMRIRFIDRMKVFDLMNMNTEI
jgi:hypothetical protein